MVIRHGVKINQKNQAENHPEESEHCNPQEGRVALGCTLSNSNISLIVLSKPNTKAWVSC